MCAPIHTDTRAHAHHAAMGLDLHPTILAFAGEEADGVAGVGSRLMPRGSGFAPLMLKNQSRKNHYKESSWGKERKEKKMEGEEKGKEKREEGMGNDGNPRGYRGQRLDAEY